jgi:hypothetical protein
MSGHNPFAKPRKAPKPRKDREYRDKRVYKADKSELRLQAYERAEGRCEFEVFENLTDDPAVMVDLVLGMRKKRRCNADAPWDGPLTVRGHMAHKRHGIHRDDTLAGVLWGCANCHLEGDHGSKCTYRRRPGKVMTPAKALEYWNGMVCFCDDPKAKFRSFCEKCFSKLSGQSSHDLRTLKGKEWLEALAAAETELMRSSIKEKA